MTARGIFVTGTDTGAGKTLVSCAILAALKRRGLRVAACKPVETGCPEKDGTRVGEDCERLAAATGQLPGAVAACLLSAPAAPMVAAEAEGFHIRRHVLLDHFAVTARDTDFVLVESAGGLMVPVADGYTTRDLAADLALPVLCVVASRLGCINHALLTIEVLRSSGLTTAGFVMNEIGGGEEFALALRTNRNMIGRFAGVADLGALPFIDAVRRGDMDHLAALAEEHLDLDAILRCR
ncbi:MAG: dethiobiotin synthase [Candidatus Binatia bacterium]